MNEYSVTYKVTLPGLFSNKEFTDTEVYIAKDAKDAIRQCRDEYEREKVKHGLSHRGLVFGIVEVRKI